MTLTNRPTAMSRRRPKRQRNPTTIYSDDRPNTFATKRWKGQIVYGPEQPSTLKSTLSPREESSSTTIMPPPSTTLVTTTIRKKRGPGRPPRKKSFQEPVRINGCISAVAMDEAPHHNQDDDDDDGNNNNSSSNIIQNMKSETIIPVPVKRKRGRPPKIRKENNNSTNNSTTETIVVRNPLNDSIIPTKEVSLSSLGGNKSSNNNKSTTQPTSITPSSRKLSPSFKGSFPHGIGRQRKRSLSINNSQSTPLRTISWTAPQDDLEGTFLNHPITMAPILPPILKHDDYDDDDDDNNHNQKCHHQGDTSTLITNNDPANTLKATYPAVYNDGGVPKDCTMVMTPFSSSTSFSQSTNTLSTNSSSKNQPLSQSSQLPSWTPLYTPPVFFDDDYDRETGHLDVDCILPVTRKITALTVRKPHHDYLALGDSAGFVLIYTLNYGHRRPVVRLESVACQQRARPEQERLRSELRRRKRAKVTKSTTTSNNNKSISKGGPLALMSSSLATVWSGPQSSQSILMDTSDTTIHALGMIGERVVLATSIELECLDVPSATSLWVCPLSSNRFVTSLDMHLHTFDVLVSCSKTDVSSLSPSPTPPGHHAPPVPPPVSSLMLLQHSNNNVEICDANSPMLVRSPSCTAIWDVGCSNRLLFVALSSTNRQELELVLVSGGGKSIDQWKVACKTKIPIKSSSGAASTSNTTKLTQSNGGVYTLVASSRGIRLYQTESLQLIHVYGDQLSLHGQSVMWKDCWLAGSFYQESKGIHKSRQQSLAPWLDVNDWLAYSSLNNKKTNIKKDASRSSSSTTTTELLPPYIVGVPHVKGPRELCETLHVWKVEHASVVPTLTIPMPHKGGGALGLVRGSSGQQQQIQDRIILVTNDGQGHELLPKMESNFAGIMYPPGYQIITDNIEFIEEEDALDEVVQYDNLSDEEDDSEDDLEEEFDDDMDEELKEAMRQSLLEHQRQEEAWEAVKHDQEVDILVDGPTEEIEFLPCRPEPYLRQFIHNPADDEEDDEDENDDDQKEVPVKDVHETAAGPSASTTHVEKKERVSTTATFIANVLEVLPNMEKPQSVVDEDCLSFTTTKVVVAVNPVPVVPSRPGRGRKSRPGNVEAMLKASINPYLQSMMLGLQGVPADGSGSSLAKGKEEENFASIAANTQQNHLSGEGNNKNGNNTRYSTPDPKSATADEAAVVLGLLGLSPNPNNTAFKPIDALASIGVPPVTTTTATMGSVSSHASAYLCASTLSSLPAKSSTAADHHASDIFTNGSTTGHAAESLTASSDRGSVTEDSVVGDLSTVMKQTNHDSDRKKKNCHACRGRHVVHTCGKRALPIDYDEVAKAERERREKEGAEKKRLRAEKRRLADQRRREAKKQKQRELEEQRLREEEQERQEKERQARLQEDFASQDLNRMRRDQIVAAYAQFQGQGSLEIHSVNYSRPEATTSTEAAAPASETFEAVSRLPGANTFKEELSRPRVGSIFEQASRMIDNTATRKPISAGEAAAIYNKTTTAMGNPVTYRVGVAVREQGYNLPAPLAIPPPPRPPVPNHANNTSMASAAAQLEALDGLAALAELARATPDASSQPDSSLQLVDEERSSGLSTFSYVATSSAQASGNNSTSFSYAVSHGFGAVSSPGEGKSGIPSYAAIRGEAKGDTNQTPKTTGGTQQQTVETYTWPPPREQQL